MPLFEVQAVVDGKEVSHVAEYATADEARAASSSHLGPDDSITDVLELTGLYGATRRLAAARLDQTADDRFKLLG